MATLIGTSAPGVKVTMFMQQGKFTWSESHYLLTYTNPQDAMNLAYQICSLRAACLGYTAFLIACRLSKTPANGQVLDLDPFLFTPTGSWPADPTGGNYSSDHANTALLIQIQGIVSRKNLYFAGIPDNVIITGNSFPNGFTMNPSFSTALNNYLSYIAPPNGASGIGFRHRNKVQDAFATGLVTNALYPNAVGVQVAAQLANVDIHSEVFLSGWRRSNPRVPGLAGAFQVIGVIPAGVSSGSWTYFLGETGNVSPTNFLNLGRIGLLQYDLVQYANYFVRRATTRKRGGSYGLPHGKSRATR